MHRFVLSLVICLFFSSVCAAKEGFDGLWKSVNDKDGKVTAIWRFKTKGQKLVGEIVDYPNAKPSDTCEKCTGNLSEFLNKPIKGTEWMQLNHFDDGTWEDGFIIDSEKGKKYTAKIWLDGDKLKLRGYIGIFYRTQTWLRSKSDRLH